MGRWTPLILMAGGLAILLGTLLGISFPMGGQNAARNSDAQGNRASRVLPANINVDNNTTATEPTNNNRNNVAQAQQDSTNINDQIEETDTTTQENQPTTNTNQNNEPIRALW